MCPSLHPSGGLRVLPYTANGWVWIGEEEGKGGGLDHVWMERNRWWARVWEREEGWRREGEEGEAHVEEERTCHA